MAGSDAKTIKTLSAEFLRRFARQFDDLTLWQIRWRALVGESMAAHSEPISFEAGRLTVAADGPAWASRVRQAEAALGRALRADPALRGLRDIKVIVRPTKPKIAPTTVTLPKPSRISARAAQLVRSTATSVSDPELRAALERLGNVDKDKK